MSEIRYRPKFKHALGTWMIWWLLLYGWTFLDIIWEFKLQFKSDRILNLWKIWNSIYFFVTKRNGYIHCCFEEEKNKIVYVVRARANIFITLIVQLSLCEFVFDSFSNRLVLRIRVDAQVAQCPLGEKYGCNPDTEAPNLIEVSKSLGLNVCISPRIYICIDLFGSYCAFDFGCDKSGLLIMRPCDMRNRNIRVYNWLDCEINFWTRF